VSAISIPAVCTDFQISLCHLVGSTVNSRLSEPLGLGLQIYGSDPKVQTGEITILGISATLYHMMSDGNWVQCRLSRSTLTFCLR